MSLLHEPYIYLKYNSEEGAIVNSFENGASSVTLTSMPGGETLVADGTGPDLAVKSLVAGSGITLTPGPNEITIDASGGGSTVTSAGGTSLVKTGTGNPIVLKGLTAGTGISLVAGTDDVTINNTLTAGADTVTLTYADVVPGHIEWIANGVGPNLTMKKLVIDDTSLPGLKIYTDADWFQLLIDSSKNVKGLFFVSGGTTLSTIFETDSFLPFTFDSGLQNMARLDNAAAFTSITWPSSVELRAYVQFSIYLDPGAIPGEVNMDWFLKDTTGTYESLRFPLVVQKYPNTISDSRFFFLPNTSVDVNSRLQIGFYNRTTTDVIIFQDVQLRILWTPFQPSF